MLIKAQNKTLEEKPNMRGGQGVVKMGQFDVSSLKNCRLAAEIVFESGCSIGSHVHTGESELFYVLEGEVVYNDNGTECVLRGGDFSVCRDGEEHGVRNETDSAAKLFAVIITH